jgi:hypothetical protein
MFGVYMGVIVGIVLSLVLGKYMDWTRCLC